MQFIFNHSAKCMLHILKGFQILHYLIKPEVNQNSAYNQRRKQNYNISPWLVLNRNPPSDVNSHFGLNQGEVQKYAYIVLSTQ